MLVNYHLLIMIMIKALMNLKEDVLIVLLLLIINPTPMPMLIPSKCPYNPTIKKMKSPSMNYDQAKEKKENLRHNKNKKVVFQLE